LRQKFRSARIKHEICGFPFKGGNHGWRARQWERKVNAEQRPFEIEIEIIEIVEIGIGVETHAITKI
jgi:hypothetical protein